VPVSRIDRIWIFTAHLGKLRETGLFVLSLMPEEEADRQRTLVTLQYQAETIRNKLVLTDSLSEEGRAPMEQIERVISGVVARAHEESGELVTARIEGQEERWSQLLEQLGIQA
jgi:hypothetical protein